MKILHYSLGLFPYRTGGLTKYATDLMLEQSKENHEVCLLYPGKINIINKKTKIVTNKKFNKIQVYELINPLPVPLLEGIKNIGRYIENREIKIYSDFLSQLKPDIIHVHTFMGLPKEFLEAANRKNIKIIFTSHDYFGLCPKVNLLNSDGINCNGYNNLECTKCCAQALSIPKITIMQSHIYKTMKNFILIKFLRKKQKSKIVKRKQNKKEIHSTIKYDELFKYYKEMFKLVDAFHFNSEVAYKTYTKHIKINKYLISTITHCNIIDKRKQTIQNKTFSNKLRIAYLGAESYEKGYFFLIKIMNELKKKYDNFELNVFFKTNIKEKYIKINKPYNYENIDDVYKNIDVVISPSRWNETFGFIVLESLAHGTPVIVSQNVGSSKFIENGKTGYLYKNAEELKQYLENLMNDKNTILKMQKEIIKNKYTFDMKTHVKKIMDFYEEMK